MNSLPLVCIAMSCLNKDFGSGESGGDPFQMILGIILGACHVRRSRFWASARLLSTPLDAGLSASIGINVGNNVQALGLQQQQAEGSEKTSKTFVVVRARRARISILQLERASPPPSRDQGNSPQRILIASTPPTLVEISCSPSEARPPF